MAEVRRRRGFERAAQLVAGQVRGAGESRGFAVSRVLTHWSEIVGPEVAAVTRPVEVGYGKGFGATLTILVGGAHAPLIEMQKEAIRERVNACYGYAAIQKIRITQTAASGFAEAAARYDAGPEVAPDAVSLASARQAAEGIGDADLRAALERLGANVLSQSRHVKK